MPAWEVPWGWQTTTIGLLAWGASFLLAGIITIPLGINLLGVTDYKGMTAMQQSQIQLLDQVCTATNLACCSPFQRAVSTILLRLWVSTYVIYRELHCSVRADGVYIDV